MPLVRLVAAVCCAVACALRPGRGSTSKATVPAHARAPRREALLGATVPALARREALLGGAATLFGALLVAPGPASAAATYQPPPPGPALDEQQRKAISDALEKAVKETAAAAVAAAAVTREFLDDPATKKLVGDASQVAADAGAAAGKTVLDLARNTDVNSVTRTAAETADVLSLPVRVAAAATADDPAKAIGEAIDAWSKTPGVKDLAATSATTASALADEALKASAAALEDVSKRAESGELTEDVKNVYKVAKDVTATIGLDKAATGVGKAVGESAVDVLSEALGGGAALEEKVSKAGSSLGGAVLAAAANAPSVAGFAAGFGTCALLNVGKDPTIAYQEREIKRLKDELGTVTGLKAAATAVTDAVSSAAEEASKLSVSGK